MLWSEMCDSEVELDAEVGDSNGKPEAAVLEPSEGPWPDTDSEYGDYTAVRAFWREIDGAAPPRRWPVGGQPAPPPAGGVPAAGGAADYPREPRSRARSGAARGEDPPRSQAAVQERRCRGQKARVAQAQMMKAISGAKDLDNIATVMVRNLPVGCRRDELVHALNGSGFGGGYDFCYLPCDFTSRSSKGLAFVNFREPAIASHFKNAWHGSLRFPGHSDSRALQVRAAHIQGYEANLAMALQSLGSTRNPNFRRLVLIKRDPQCPTIGRASLISPPAARLPTATQQFNGQAVAAGSQDLLPRSPGMFSSPCASTSLHPATAQFVSWNPQSPLKRPPGIFAR